MTYRSLIPYVHVRNLALERYAWRRAAAHPFVCYLLRRVLRAENMGRASLRQDQGGISTKATRLGPPRHCRGRGCSELARQSRQVALKWYPMTKWTPRLGPAVQDGCGPLIENRQAGTKAGRRCRLEWIGPNRRRQPCSGSASFKLAGRSRLAIVMPVRARAQPMSA